MKLSRLGITALVKIVLFRLSPREPFSLELGGEFECFFILTSLHLFAIKEHVLCDMTNLAIDALKEMC